MSNLPIVITAGDPAGIGYDIIATSWQKGALDGCVVIADPNVLSARALTIGATLHEANAPQLQPIRFNSEVIAGEGNADHARVILQSLDMAIDGCNNGQYAAMVTAPLNKALINDGGIHFSGHTEYLAERTGALLPVMMLANEQLRVVLVTTHIPLNRVATSLSRDLLATVISTTESALRTYWRIDQPRIAVLGLNPHAGENGHIGDEDHKLIAPCINNMVADGLDIEGPMPACTAFVPHIARDFDAIIAMYHDQGLPAIKAQGFGETVNITLGLPIIRTSVDHGTAYNIAGSGKADDSSLLSALNVARCMAQ